MAGCWHSYVSRNKSASVTERKCLKNLGLAELTKTQGKASSMVSLGVHTTSWSSMSGNVSPPGQASRTDAAYRKDGDLCTICSMADHISPPRTTLPIPASSPFAPLLLASSNSLMIPATITFLSLASALLNKSPTPGAHIVGEEMRLMIRV